MKKKIRILILVIVVVLVLGILVSRFFSQDMAFKAEVESSGFEVPVVELPQVPQYELFQTWTAIYWPKDPPLTMLIPLDADPNFQFMVVTYSGGVFQCAGFKDLKDYQSSISSLETGVFSSATCGMTNSLKFRDLPGYGTFALAKSFPPRYIVFR